MRKPRIPVNAIVVISKMGKEHYRHTMSNPWDLQGTLTGYRDWDGELEVHCYQVHWSNGYSNCYEEGELDWVNAEIPSEKELEDMV